MRLVLSIIGGIFLALVLVLWIFVGYSAYRGPQLDASSRGYLDENLPLILSTWSIQELRSRSSSQLLEVFDDRQARLLFGKLSALGQLKKYGDVKGEANIAFTPGAGRVITATYSARANFENGDAVVRVRLILQDDKWKFLSFYVDSPILIQ